MRVYSQYLAGLCCFGDSDGALRGVPAEGVGVYLRGYVALRHYAAQIAP